MWKLLHNSGTLVFLHPKDSTEVFHHEKSIGHSFRALRPHLVCVSELTITTLFTLRVTVSSTGKRQWFLFTHLVEEVLSFRMRPFMFDISLSNRAAQGFEKKVWKINLKFLPQITWYPLPKRSRSDENTYRASNICFHDR